MNLTYLAFERGPVPKEISDNRKNYNSPLFKFLEIESRKIQIIPKPKAKPDLDYFSPYEIKLMNKLIEIYASGNFPDPKFGAEIKPRWFIYFGTSSIFSIPIIAYISTATTKIKDFNKVVKESRMIKFIFRKTTHRLMKIVF